MKRWMLVGFAMLTMLMVVTSSAAAQPANNGGPGNSSSANQCQKGGWASLARIGDADTAFVSQGECVVYGAQGGTLVPYVPFVYNPVVTASMAFDGNAHCGSQISATGFAPNTEYAAYYLYNGSPTGHRTIMTDATGNWTGSAGSDYQGSPATFQFVIHDVSSNVVTYSC